MITFILSKFTLVVELLAAQTALLYSYPKRNKFLLRIVTSYALCIVAAAGLYCIPYVPKMWFIFFHLFRMLLIISLTVVAAFFCYDCKIGAVFSACIGGEAVQHIGYHVAILVSVLPFMPAMNIYTEVCCCFLVVMTAFLTVGRSAKKNSYYKNYDRRMIAVSVVIVAMCIGINRLWQSGKWDGYTMVAISLYAIVCNVLALFIQYFLYRFAYVVGSNIVLRRLNEEGRKQYELSRENIELLNQKCHDLKHKLVLAGDKLPREEIDSMKESIELYDRLVKTGNDAFDVIVNEKMIWCLRNGVGLTVMGDAQGLAFMNVMDIYSFFGNALDNAIEAVEHISDPKLRSISLTIERRGQLVNVSVINYSDKKIDFSAGLPKTTKSGEQGYHGFGLKSIQSIARKYGGDISTSCEGGVFRLNAYMLNTK